MVPRSVEPHRTEGEHSAADDRRQPREVEARPGRPGGRAHLQQRNVVLQRRLCSEGEGGRSTAICQLDPVQRPTEHPLRRIPGPRTVELLVRFEADDREGLPGVSWHGPVVILRAQQALVPCACAVAGRAACWPTCEGEGSTHTRAQANGESEGGPAAAAHTELHHHTVHRIRSVNDAMRRGEYQIGADERPRAAEDLPAPLCNSYRRLTSRGEGFSSAHTEHVGNKQHHGAQLAPAMRHRMLQTDGAAAAEAQLPTARPFSCHFVRERVGQLLSVPRDFALRLVFPSPRMGGPP